MMDHLQYDNRQVLPRWFLYHALRNMSVGYRTNLRSPTPPESFQLEEAVANWRERPSLSLAVELLAAAQIAGALEDKFTKEALSFTRSARNAQDINPLLHKLLSLIEEENNGEDRTLCINPIDVASTDGRSKIAAAKKRLILQPHDAIAWIDLAFLYTIRGLPSKARRCVDIASSLAPGNRNITRFSARFYIHVCEPEQALDLIRSSPIIPRDPLLIASEIAISEAFGLKSRFISKGRKIIDAAHHSREDLNELNATLSTIEFWAGNNRKGKKFTLDIRGCGGWKGTRL